MATTYSTASAYWADRKARDAKRTAECAALGLKPIDLSGKRPAGSAVRVCSNQPICKICCVCGDW